MYIYSQLIFRVNGPNSCEAKSNVPESTIEMKDVYVVLVLTQFEVSARGICTGLSYCTYGLEDVF